MTPTKHLIVKDQNGRARVLGISMHSCALLLRARFSSAVLFVFPCWCHAGGPVPIVRAGTWRKKFIKLRTDPFTGNVNCMLISWTLYPLVASQSAGEFQIQCSRGGRDSIEPLLDRIRVRQSLTPPLKMTTVFVKPLWRRGFSAWERRWPQIGGGIRRRCRRPDAPGFPASLPGRNGSYAR
jgi:hypothetical protein